MTTNSSEPLKLFYCYAHEDKALRDELDAHLAVMKRQKLLEVWYDRQIMPGTKWEKVIDKNLTSAHIILLLVSASFLNSDYCYGIELQKALQRDAAGTARVVPIILRPVDWEDAPFSELQVLPTGAKPVTRWVDRDDAFEDIAKELRKVAKQLSATLKAEELRISSKTKEDWLKEGIALNDLKQNEEALVAYNQAIRLDPNYALAYNNKGNALNDLKRHEEALAAYNHAIRLDPNYALAYNNKGVALYNLKRYEEAIVACDHAIRLNPNFAAAYSNKGSALDNLKRYEEAIVACDHAIRLDPNFAIAYYNKGNVLQNMNRGKEAQAAFQKAKQLGFSN